MANETIRQLGRLEALYKGLIRLVALLMVGVGVAAVFALLALLQSMGNQDILQGRSDLICDMAEADGLVNHPYCERINRDE